MAEKEPTDVSVDLAALQKLPVSEDHKTPTGLDPCPKTCALTCINTCKWTGVVEPTVIEPF